MRVCECMRVHISMPEYGWTPETLGRGWVGGCGGWEGGWVGVVGGRVGGVGRGGGRVGGI